MVDYGNQDPKDIRAAHPSTYSGDHIADGSLNSNQVCSGTKVCYQGGDHVSAYLQCDSAKTISACEDFQYTYNIDSATDLGGCTDKTPTVQCDRLTETFCGTATDASQCEIVPEAITPGYKCSDSTIALCNAKPSLSNCRAISGETVNGIFCDKTKLAYTKCPGTPKWSCPLTEPVQKCKQQSCKTVTNSGLTYKSPINNECQSNAIILLSDGEPTVSNSASKVSNLIGSPYSILSNGQNCTTVPVPTTSDDWGNQENIDYHGRCGIGLARFLSETDNSPLKADGTGDSVAGKQAINVYTIGFALQGSLPAQAYLNDIAQAGGGAFFTAEDGPELVKALKNAITGATKRARLFSAPTFTISTGTSLTNGEDVYLPVFKKALGPRWQGNLKKFKQVDGKLVDANNKNIFDTNGKLLASAQDFWATSAGTDFVTSGGAANKIKPSTRNVLTDDGGALVPLTAANVSATDLGVASTKVAELINFVQGKNASGTPRHTMGDIIHSKPVFVPNLGLANEGIIFIGTNEGFVHAINAKDGTEAFAYMPSELLKNIKTLHADDSDDKHPYGVDSEITVWDQRYDKLDLSSKASKKVMLYFGLRRGGQAYYALDVTDPTKPILKWKKDNKSSGYSELGYTFSKPKLSYLRYGSTVAKTLNPVLVFGGGYIDDNGQSGTVEMDDGNTSRGSAVYIVDALTGNVVWKNENKLDYAVAGNIQAMDIDRDGSIDRLYFGDTGGTIWRADLNVSLASSNADNGSVKARLKEFATLGDVSSPATAKRKFFTSPDIAFFRHQGKLVITLAIGSGDRATPLEENSDDHFFVLVDRNPVTVPTSAPDAIEFTDLGPRKSPTSSGWRYDLIEMTGEKVLSSPLIFNNNVVFSTFGKGSTTTSVKNCSTLTTNRSRTYLMDLMTGKASVDLDGSGGLPKDPDDLSVEGRSGVISQSPQIVFTKLKSADPTDADQSCQKGSCERAFEIVDGSGVSIANDLTSGASTGADKTLPRTYWLEKKTN
jgi:Tfp pilus tip-associated adhesin PilY1